MPEETAFSDNITIDALGKVGLIVIQLITPRLLIRDHILKDLPTHHGLFSSEKVMCFLPETMTNNLEQSRKNLQDAIDQIDHPKRSRYFLRIEDRRTYGHIGEVGYTVTDFTPQGKLIDAGYFIQDAYWGQGYATEAFRELIRFAFEEDDVYRISCGCLKENAASERVIQKCGLIKETDFKEYQWHDGRLKDRVEYRLLRSEWLPSH